MPRYQIRLPEGMEIEDFVHELSAKSWQLVSQSSKGIDWPARKDEKFREFQASVKKMFVPVVKSFRLCGLSNICSENLESTELSLQSHTLDASPTDKIYQFFLVGTLQDFLNHLTAATVETLRDCMVEGSEKEVESILHVAFWDVLGTYLYECPTCGKTELCLCSQEAPVKVWKSES